MAGLVTLIPFRVNAKRRGDLSTSRHPERFLWLPGSLCRVREFSSPGNLGKTQLPIRVTISHRYYAWTQDQTAGSGNFKLGALFDLFPFNDHDSHPSLRYLDHLRAISRVKAVIVRYFLEFYQVRRRRGVVNDMQFPVQIALLPIISHLLLGTIWADFVLKNPLRAGAERTEPTISSTVQFRPTWVVIVIGRVRPPDSIFRSSIIGHQGFTARPDCVS